MHASFSDGQAVGHPHPTSAPDQGRYCATQSTDEFADFGSLDEPFYPLSASSLPVEAAHLPSYSITINTDFPTYPYYPQIHSAGSSLSPPSQGMWPTPPPTTYEGECLDGSSYKNSPASGPPGNNHAAADYRAGFGLTASPRSWSSPEIQQFSLPQALWRSSEETHPYNMRMCPANVQENNFHQQMIAPPYGDPSCSLPETPNPDTTLSSQGSPPMKVEAESPSALAVDSHVQGVTSEETPETEGSARPDEPYAQLIYRAFMSRNEKAMTLQEMYQWFRDNTDKPVKSGNKGWQNSIRHNLSMNHAFVKRDRTPSSDAVQVDSSDSKKSTEWMLEEWAIHNGVQSTTRYRKGNPSRRGGSGSRTRGPGNQSAMASSGRKGGISTSRTKSAATRRTNHRHVQPSPSVLSTQHHLLHESLYGRRLIYYPGSLSRPDYVQSSSATVSDLLFHEPINTTRLSASMNQGYLCGGDPQQLQHQAYQAYSLQNHPSTVYSLDDVSGIYQEPTTDTSVHLPGTTSALSTGLTAVFANPEDISDDGNSHLEWSDGVFDGSHQQ